MTLFSRLLIILTFFFVNNDIIAQYRYTFGPSSILHVNGKTNINRFQCISCEQITDRALNFTESIDHSIVTFSNGNLDIDVFQMDCGRKEMNKDFQKTLKADQFPQIKLSLISAETTQHERLLNCDQWASYRVFVNITIADVCHTEEVFAQVQKVDDSHFLCRGNMVVSFTDFGLEVPTAMLGLIRVKNALQIEFDLDIIVEQDDTQATH